MNDMAHQQANDWGSVSMLYQLNIFSDVYQYFIKTFLTSPKDMFTDFRGIKEEG